MADFLLNQSYWRVVLSDSSESLYEKAFPFLVSGLFLIIGCFGILNHEMWRDEVQPWLIVKASSSLITVFHTIGYEGHPGLWYTLLYLLSKLTSSMVAFQLLHLTIAAITVYVFAAFAPFSNLQRGLFAFGYFPFYEYSIIARNYAIGVLFAFVLCALYPHRQRRYVAIGIVLALMANCNASAAIIAISFFLVLAADYFSQTPGERGNPVEASAGSSIFVLGLILAALQMNPNPNSCYSTDWYLFFTTSHFKATVSTIASAYLPIPDIKHIDFWNYNLLAVSRLSGPFMPYISLMLFACCAVSLYRPMLVLCLYLYGTFGLMLFAYLVHYGSLRNHGHLFIILVMCYWVAACHEDSAKLDVTEIKDFWYQKTRNVILTVLLLVHLIVGLFAFVTDLRSPFSAGRAVADFIKGAGLAETLVVGDGPYVATVGAYLNKEVYQADRRRFGTFVVYDRGLYKPSCEEVLDAAKHLGKTRRSDIILVLNKEILCRIPDVKIQLLMKITDTIVADERAYVYLIKQEL